MTDRNSPIRQLLDAAATGHRPHRADIDRLPVFTHGDGNNALRRKIRDATEQVVKLRLAGDNLPARRLAADLAADFADAGHDPVRPPADLDALSPRELADLVPRHGGGATRHDPLPPRH